MKSSELLLAEFIDLCCGRYAKEHTYRNKLRRELKQPVLKKTIGRKAA